MKTPDCDHEHRCITCGDVATGARVLSVDAGQSLALVEVGGGSQVTVETGLLDPVSPGEALLVHAGCAIARLPEQDGL